MPPDAPSPPRIGPYPAPKHSSGSGHRPLNRPRMPTARLVCMCSGMRLPPAVEAASFFGLRTAVLMPVTGTGSCPGIKYNTFPARFNPGIRTGKLFSPPKRFFSNMYKFAVQVSSGGRRHGSGIRPDLARISRPPFHQESPRRQTAFFLPHPRIIGKTRLHSRGRRDILV